MRGKLLQFDFISRLRGIRCPVLLLAGELDPIVAIEDAEELAAALPPDRLRFERFADAGHLLAVEHPDAVLALIREFVLDRPSRDAAIDWLDARWAGSVRESGAGALHFDRAGGTAERLAVEFGERLLQPIPDAVPPLADTAAVRARDEKNLGGMSYIKSNDVNEPSSSSRTGGVSSCSSSMTRLSRWGRRLS